MQVDSMQPSFLESKSNRLMNLDRANDVSSQGRPVQADCIKTYVESAYGVCSHRLNMHCFQR